MLHTPRPPRSARRCSKNAYAHDSVIVSVYLHATVPKPAVVRNACGAFGAHVDAGTRAGEVPRRVTRTRDAWRSKLRAQARSLEAAAGAATGSTLRAAVPPHAADGPPRSRASVPRRWVPSVLRKPRVALRARTMRRASRASRREETEEHVREPGRSRVGQMHVHGISKKRSRRRGRHGDAFCAKCSSALAPCRHNSAHGPNAMSRFD